MGSSLNILKLDCLSFGIFLVKYEMVPSLECDGLSSVSSSFRFRLDADGGMPGNGYMDDAWVDSSFNSCAGFNCLALVDG